MSGDNAQKLNQLKEVLAVSETGMKGIEEMETVFGYVGRWASTSRWSWTSRWHAV